MGQTVSQEPAAADQRPPAGRLGPAALKRDFLASIVVFLVALPLCLGIANACGVNPALGLITGIIGGLVVGVLAGCPLQVSGPAAGLVTVVAAIVADERLGVAMLGVIVLGAGALQLVAGAFRLGQWFRAVSPAVVEGMLAGIGVLIFASQLHVMVDDRPRDSGLQNILTIPEAIYKGVVASDDVLHDEAARIGLLTIAVLVGWKVLAPRRLQLLPAPLLAILVGTLACLALGWDIRRVNLPDNLSEAVILPGWEALRRLGEPAVLTAVGTVAFVASAETLLCANAVDQLHQGPRTRYDKELAAQGLGNVLCGLLGALPMTGVIVRSAANVEAGARTRLSAVLHGGWLLLTVLLLTALLERVPVACLAAVLVYTGYKLVNYVVVKELYQFGWGEVAIYFCTLGGVVLAGLLEGVIIGVVLSALKLLYRFSHLAIDLKVAPDGTRTVLHLEGAATFLRLPQLAAALERVPAATELHVQFERLTYIDHACLELLMTWEKQHEAVGGALVIDWMTLHGRFLGAPANGEQGAVSSQRSAVSEDRT